MSECSANGREFVPTNGSFAVLAMSLIPFTAVIIALDFVAFVPTSTSCRFAFCSSSASRFASFSLISRSTLPPGIGCIETAPVSGSVTNIISFEIGPNLLWPTFTVTPDFPTCSKLPSGIFCHTPSGNPFCLASSGDRSCALGGLRKASFCNCSLSACNALSGSGGVVRRLNSAATICF